MHLFHRTCAALLASFLLLATAPNAAAVAVLFNEDWEADAVGWTLASGASRDCSTGFFSSCSLKMAPACCGTRVTAEHSLIVPTAATPTVSFVFKGSATTGDTDTEFRIITDSEHLVFALTRPGGNNVMSLDNGQPNHNACGSWASANAWYAVTITLNGLTDSAQAEVYNSLGTKVGSCTYPVSGTLVTSLRIDGVDYGSGLVYHYDNIVVSI